MPVKIVFLISPKTHFLDLAGPDQVFFEARDYGAPFELEYCSYSDKPSTSSGLPFGKLKHFSRVHLSKGDFIFIPGVDIQLLLSKETTKQDALFNWLKKAYSREVNICTVCTGTFLLAASGLLDGKNCTTHWKRTAQLKKEYPQLNVIENVLFTEDNGIYTSAGIASGIDMALHIVEKLMGEYFAHKVARELVLYMRRSGNQPQESLFLNYRNHIHAGIHKAQDWITENIHKKASLAELARTACMSNRNFTRVFKKETGITVNDFITMVRKEKLKELVKNPDLSRLQLAGHIGLRSERQLSRLIHSN